MARGKTIDLTSLRRQIKAAQDTVQEALTQHTLAQELYNDPENRPQRGEGFGRHWPMLGRVRFAWTVLRRGIPALESVQEGERERRMARLHSCLAGIYNNTIALNILISDDHFIAPEADTIEGLEIVDNRCAHDVLLTEACLQCAGETRDAAADSELDDRR